MHVHTQVLKEVVRSMLTGSSQQGDAIVGTSHAGRRWTQHLFATKNGEPGGVVAHFARFEFQDGKRKKTSQQYHGRGTVHVHFLIWLENAAAVKLEDVVSATLSPQDPIVNGYVRGDKTTPGKSGQDVYEEGPSFWDPDANRLILRHTEEDRCVGRRGYLPDVMDVLKCHMDVQFQTTEQSGRWVLGRYVSTYVAKFSDSMAQEFTVQYFGDKHIHTNPTQLRNHTQKQHFWKCCRNRNMRTRANI